MKALIFSVILLLSVKTLASSTANQCQTSELGTKIKVTLALENGASEVHEFEVKTCKKNTYVAVDTAQNTAVIQYAAGQGEKRNIRFLSGTDSKNVVRSELAGQWNTKTGEVSFTAPSSADCPAGQHHDSSMGGMCMPDNCPTGQHWDSSMNMCMPDSNSQSCPAGQHWDSSMNMCMPDGNSKSLTAMFHYNQFLIATTSSGPRGRSAVSAPNMWMLMLDKKTSDRNTLEVSWMGTTDLWTVPSNGTPELLQTGEANAAGVPFVDAQHPHSSPIMGLTFSDILSYGANGENKLTFFFAPRGEATAGPENFMHRASAEGNPDAPLGHHLQDVFHISSTVIGMKVDHGKLTVEGSVFSGAEPSPSQVNLDMHTPDSYAFRVNYRVDKHITVGGSFANVKALDRVNNPENKKETEHATAAWIESDFDLGKGTIKSSTIWGRNENITSNEQLNSFLEEIVYSLGKNNFYGRVEVLQRTPDQLEIQTTDGKTGAKWVKAITLGYERQVLSRGGLQLYTGAAVSKYSLPKEYQAAYGKSPTAAKVYLRLKFNTSSH